MDGCIGHFSVLFTAYLTSPHLNSGSAATSLVTSHISTLTTIRGATLTGVSPTDTVPTHAHECPFVWSSIAAAGLGMRIDLLIQSREEKEMAIAIHHCQPPRGFSDNRAFEHPYAQSGLRIRSRSRFLMMVFDNDTSADSGTHGSCEFDSLS